MRRNLNRLSLLSALCLLLSALPSNAAPAKKKKPSLLQSLGKTLDTGSTSGKPTTVTGVRGLDEPGGPVDTAARDFDAIDRLEKMQVTPEELKMFLAEGKLP